MTASTESAPPLNKGQHYEFIKSTVSDSFKTATVTRGLALAATRMAIKSWYTTAPPAYLKKLAACNLKAWDSQNKVDHLLDKIDLYTFAAPLLQAKLKERYGVVHDVKTTWLRLYMPKDTPWYALDVASGVTSRTVSLLDAALHNFAAGETVTDDSQYITQPDERGNFDVVSIKSKMTISQFQALCRELDIGAQYKTHLERYLLPGEPVAEEALKSRVIESQKDALAVAAELALITGDIQYDAYKLVLELNREKPRLLLNGKRMRCYDLSMLGTRLTGILLLFPAVSDDKEIKRVIAYVPHDPDHPLKEYPSLKEFGIELTRQLREDRFIASTKQRYRQFFSQFVDQQQRGHFFADLEQRLFIVRYHPKENHNDQRPAWRIEAVKHPNLQFKRVGVPDDYWRYAYQQKLNKILNDAREVAVSTADTDSNARWAWWDNFKKIVSDIFNVALLVATPFVPGLGEVMMVYTAFQLTNDVIEGIFDLAEGLALEAAEHVISVVTDVIQLAGFAVGTTIGKHLWVKLSALVDGMKPVKLPNGKPALWHPDLAPYEQKNLTLPAGSKPDSHGLHQFAHEALLPLDGKLYSVEKASPHPDSRTHRIKHPSRPNAYQPKVEHNEHGAWRHEAESPNDWDDQALMRRLGHSVERFSPAELEQIRISSGTEIPALRQMHNDNNPPPPLLADTIKRFTARDDALLATANIRAGQPLDPQSDWFEPITTALPGWPSTRAIKVVYDAAQWSDYSRKYGDTAASDANTLTISQADLNAGQLPERLTGFLDDGEMNALLGREVPAAQRTQALRDLLADAVQARQGEVSERLYQASERSSKADIRVVKQTFPDLPLSVAQTLLAQASPAELQRIVSENRLPLRLKALARELNFEACTTRAYQGFYQDESLIPDTEQLALGTLKRHSDAFVDLRIEVREGSYDGLQRSSAGADDAPLLRRLVRNEFGRYEVLDANNRVLHGPDDFFESILNALPENVREALSYNSGQGRLFKSWIMEHAASLGERRVVLAAPPIRTVVDADTFQRGWWPFGDATPEQRIQKLYPKMNDRDAASFVKVIQSKGDADQAIERLETERQDLHDLLRRWRESYPLELDDFGEPIASVSTDYLHNGGRWIEDQLIECFERKSKVYGERSNHPEQGYALDLSSELAQPKLERWWKDLRQQPGMKKHLEQITALKLDRARISTGSDSLLNDFPQLRHLSARHCDLKEISPALGRMRHLQSLDLTDNAITLNARSSAQLSGLTRLQTLSLSGNPLRQPPDVGRMYRLNELNLANTGLERWPTGLFKVGANDRQRPRGFALDLRNCPINELPTVTPGSDQAFILSRTRVDTTRLSIADRQRYEGYRRSAGFTPQQAYLPAVTDEIAHWQSFPEGADVFSPSLAYKKYREESWHDLMAEPGSADFFKVIRKQRDGHDFAYDKSRRQLTARVWEMIDAAVLDSDLREELFKQAREPDNCEDGGAQLFNSMGIKILVSKAYNEPTSAQVLDNNLVRLARSAARLNRVAEVARTEVQRQRQQNLITPHDPATPAPDEVEVHLAYQTGLAERLELPWQSKGMHYQPRSGVTEAKINAAYDSIMAREEGNGLVDAMIDLHGDPFWKRHLDRTHPTQFAIDDELFNTKREQIEDLRLAQAEWAAANPETNINRLARKMESLASQLGVAQVEVFSGEPMTDVDYNKLLLNAGRDRYTLARRWTREAMEKAGL
ncbi:NEL-type E3 ubiquitin ligase domain-containing protein [Pseudomonas sp. FP2196]|uniref:dermonecrotic toxin domain-containing protein n=1 Tax=Pseudomonas sp. FP2196 TaxID=2954086 RepID=UPI002732D5AE|nr:DUF6543 domain-containing protein [Pseudomonas sp. FP2196]WLH34592.1 NEL-type E3 ubiquitin ligase domain-containing protein [Pseudomonas sp. FP2196]